MERTTIAKLHWQQALLVNYWYFFLSATQFSCLHWPASLASYFYSAMKIRLSPRLVWCHMQNTDCLLTAFIKCVLLLQMVFRYCDFADVDGTLITSTGGDANKLHKLSFAYALKTVFDVDTNIGIILSESEKLEKNVCKCHFEFGCDPSSLLTSLPTSWEYLHILFKPHNAPSFEGDSSTFRLQKDTALILWNAAFGSRECLYETIKELNINLKL